MSDYTWNLIETPMYTAACPKCECNLLEEIGSDFGGWSDRDGVEADMEGVDYCPKCETVLTELGRQLLQEGDNNE